MIQFCGRENGAFGQSKILPDLTGILKPVFFAVEYHALRIDIRLTNETLCPFWLKVSEYPILYRAVV